MALKNTIISFWKQVKLKSSDMFTLFRVGIGVKVPTHKLHLKDAINPLKIEGLQNDATDPDKYLSIDASNVVKYRTGAQLASDIEVSIDDLHGAGVDGAANQLLTDNGDGTVTSEADLLWDNSTLTIGNDDSSTHIIKRADRTGTAGGGRLYLRGGEAVGVNQTGGAVGMYAGAGTGTGHSGNIDFNTATGDAGSGSVVNGSSSYSYFSGEDGSLNLGGKLKITGNVIEDNDGIDCITFDSSGNTTILNTLNASLTGNVIGNTSGSSGTVTSIGNLTGDVTSSNRATTIAADAVTYAKMQNVSATNVVLGRDSAGAGIVEEISAASLREIINVEDGATADQTQADINGLAITTVGTIGTGTWNGTAIASNYLDSDTAHLSGIQTFNGLKTFSNSIIYDGDRSTTPGDGAAIHVDSSDITDNNTSASGTATAFNYVNIENPRIMASNALVTTTNASTVYIKGAPAASTNQTITNAYALNVAAGNVKLGGDLEVGGDLQVNGTNSNINLNAGSDIVLEADNAGGGLASCIQYNSSTGNKIMLGATSDVVVLCNRTLNGTVQIRANAAAGSGGEVTVATFEDDKVTISQDLDVTGNVLPGITYVKILPSDFMPDDGGRPAMIDDTSGDRWLESHGTGKLFAFVQIPLGFKATLVDVYGSATSAVTVYEADVNSATVTSKGTGNIGTQINITDVTADATNYIMIELAQASGEKVYGGKMTIAKA